MEDSSASEEGGDGGAGQNNGSVKFIVGSGTPPTATSAASQQPLSQQTLQMFNAGKTPTNISMALFQNRMQTADR